MAMSSLLPRTDYPTLNDCTYLNQASLGLIGQPAVSAMTDFIEEIARHGNRYLSDSDEVAFFENLRLAGAKILNAEPTHLAIVASASEILGQLPILIDPSPVTKILTVRTDFPALTRPWLRLSELGQHAIHFVDDDPSVDLTETLIDNLDEQTSVLAVSHVQYATGTVVDIRRLRAATQQVGAAFLVDVTQSAGAINIDATAWQADALVTSGYKWLGGHGGAALAVLSPDLIARTPLLPGWMGAPDPFDFDATQLLLSADARRFTQSTMSYASLISLKAGIEQLMAVEIDQIGLHSDQLAKILIENVSELGWRSFRPFSDKAASTHIISLKPIRQKHCNSAQAVNAELAQNNVICSSRGGRIRVSLAPYNTKEDIEMLTAALAKITEVERC